MLKLSFSNTRGEINYSVIMQFWFFWIYFWLASSEERPKSLVSLFCEKYIHSMLKMSFSDTRGEINYSVIIQLWCFWIFWLISSEERPKSLVSLFCEKYIHSMLKVSFSDLAEKLIIQLLCSFGAFEFFWLIISEERPKSLVSLFKENNIQKN